MKIGAISSARLLIFIRRLYRCVNRLADIEQARLEIEQTRFRLDYPAWKKADGEIKKAEIAVANVDDWNKRHYADHPEEEER